MTISDAAKKILIENGLPTTKNENWHYTNLGNYIKNITHIWEPSKPNTSGKGAWHSNQPSILPFIPVDKPNINNIIAIINKAGFTGGQSILLDKNTNMELLCTIEAGQQHNLLKLQTAPNIDATISSRYIAKEALLASSVIDLKIAKDNKLNYIILNDSETPLNMLQQFNATIEANAVLNLYIVNIGVQNNLLRQEINVSLLQEGANFNLRTINLLNAASHTDIYMQVEHMAPSTSSNELIRNIVLDKAFGAFQGIIKVNKIAQKTVGKMNCNSLLLSDEAVFNAKPELEIFADDVICGHGATISPLNDNILFYLTSRAIDINVAKSLLIKAFIRELLEDEIIDYLDKPIELWINSAIN